MILNSLNKFLCLSEILSITMDVVVTGNKVEFNGCGIYLVDTIINPSNDCRFNSVNLNQNVLSKFDEHCKLLDIKLHDDNKYKVVFIFSDKFNKIHKLYFTFQSDVEKPNIKHDIKHSIAVNWTPNPVISELSKRHADDYINTIPRCVFICDDKFFYINNHMLIFNCFDKQFMYHLNCQELLKCFGEGVYIKSFLYSSDELIYNDGVEYSNGCRYYFGRKTGMRLAQRMMNNFNTQLGSIRNLKPNFTLSYTNYKYLIEQIKYYNMKHKYVNIEEIIAPTLINIDKDVTKIYITHKNLNKDIDESYGEFLNRCPDDFIELISIKIIKFDHDESVTIAVDSFSFERASIIAVDDTVEFIIVDDRTIFIKQLKNNMFMTLFPLS